MSSDSEDEPMPIGWATNDGSAVSDSPTHETRAIPLIAHDRTRDPSRIERDTTAPFWILPERAPEIRDVHVHVRVEPSQGETILQESPQEERTRENATAFTATTAL